MLSLDAPGGETTARGSLEDLALARALADAADRIALAALERSALAVREKPDGSPVSDADVEIEATIVDILGRERPGDAVLGEELGGGASAGRTWIVDPIDGTLNFIRGMSTFATLIALRDERGVAVSLVSAPALRERWWAVRGAGAFRGDVRLRVSDRAPLSRAIVGYTTAASFARAGIADSFARLSVHAGAVRGYGNFLNYMLVAAGQIEGVVEPAIGVWDVAAPALIVAEAGGTVTDLAGRPDRLGGSIVATNGLVHEELLRVVAPQPARRWAPRAPRLVAPARRAAAPQPSDASA